MIDVNKIAKSITEEVALPPAPAFYPGGFKPPHKGHLAAAQNIAGRNNVTEVTILIGHGSRTTGLDITPEQSLKIWQLYLNTLNDPKIKVQLAPVSSPVKTIYSYFAEDLDRKGYVVGAQEEVEGKGYFNSIQKAFGPERVFPISVDDQFSDGGARLSGTEVREALEITKNAAEKAIANPNDAKSLNDYNKFYQHIKTYFPEEVINKGGFDEIAKILNLTLPDPKSLQQVNESITEYTNQSELNPLIFDGDKVNSEIRKVLLKVAKHFYDNLEVKAAIKDITLTGSSVNYNYTEDSDIDLHILVDFSKTKDPELTKKYFDAARKLWNDKHDIKIGENPVELYVQDINEPHRSSGVYSLVKDEWLTKPKYEKVEIDDEVIEKAALPFKSMIQAAEDSTESPIDILDQINDIQTKIKTFRQLGLDREGEYSIENLAFKNLRNYDYLDRLSNLKNKVIDSMFTADMNSLDENTLLQPIQPFFDYAVQELQIENPPSLEVKVQALQGGEQPSFGCYVPDDHHIVIDPSNRNIVDVLRTLAHELVHAKQNELGKLYPNAGETGSPIENEANALAGVLMRDYGKKNPIIFKIGMLQENKEQNITCNSCGWSWKKTDGGTDMYICHKCGYDNTPPTINEEQTQTIKKVYLDMDGVLAGFDDQFRKLFKMDPREYETKEGRNAFWQAIDDSGIDFWAGMDWEKGGQKLLQYLEKQPVELHILSSPGRSNHGKEGKLKWLKRMGVNIPSNRIHFKQAKDKKDLAAPDSLLIDDLGSNVAQFINAGGQAIKHNSSNTGRTYFILQKKYGL